MIWYLSDRDRAGGHDAVAGRFHDRRGARRYAADPSSSIHRCDAGVAAPPGNRLKSVFLGAMVAFRVVVLPGFTVTAALDILSPAG